MNGKTFSSQVKTGCCRMNNNKWTNPSQLKQKLQELEREYEKKLEMENETRQKLAELKDEFEKVNRSKILRLIHPSNIKHLLRSVGAYVLGRRNRKRLYSRAYKQK